MSVGVDVGTTSRGDTHEARARALVEQVRRATGGVPTVKIGILTPLTGPGDPVAGELIVRGACLGAEYARERGGVLGGRALEPVLCNDQADAAVEGMARSAVGGLAKLAVVDEVLAVLGQWHLRTTPHVARTAELLGVPIFVENGHNTITAEGLRTVFRTYFTIADRAPLMLRFIVGQGWRRVGLLAPNTVFGQMTADTLEAAAGALALDLEFVRFDFDQETTVSVEAELRAIAASDPDVIVNAGVVRTNYLVINQAAELGLRPEVPMMVTFPFPLRSGDYWRLAGDPGNYVIWPATRYRPSMPGLTDVGRWFTQRYVERYGSVPPDNALNAFTDVTLVAQALEIAGSDRREDLVAALETGTFETWRGPIRFDRDDHHWHHSPPDLVLMQYQRVGQGFDDAAIIYPDETRTGEYASGPDLASRDWR